MLPFTQMAPATMPLPAPGPELDPFLLLELLAEMQKPTFEPKLPAGYEKEKKPGTEAIWTTARGLEQKNARKMQRQMTTIRRLRADGTITGMFPGEYEAKRDGDLETWTDTQVVADYNMMVSIGASMEFAAVKRVLAKADRVDAQTLEDWVLYMREEELHRWGDRGDAPLNHAEYKVLLAYGEIASRHLPNLKDEEYPFTDTLVDPASFYPIFDGQRLKRAYRLYRATYAQLASDYDEPNRADKKKLEDKYGKGRDLDDRIITVAEYADCTWRAVTSEGGCGFLPPTEHRLYTNPFVYQAGPYGEPRFTDTGNAGLETDRWVGSDWHRSGPADDWGMEHKLVGAQHFQWPTHDQLEAVMSHIVTSLKQTRDPALMITRDNMNAGKPMPKISNRPGSRNELGPGESVEPFPTTANPMDVQPVLQGLNAALAKSAIPVGMYGAQQGLGSNISGNSMSNAAEAGFDMIRPAIDAMETYHTRKMAAKTLMFRNVGHLTRFSGGEQKSFLVPASRPTKTSDLASAMTPELIDRLGARVLVKLTRLRISDLIPMVNAVQGAIGAGVLTRRRAAEMIGQYDFDRLEDELNDEMLDQLVRSDPDVQKMIAIPAYIESMAEREDDPRKRAFWMAVMDFYMQKQMMAMQPQPQPGMAPAPPAPAGPPPGGPPVGGGGEGDPMFDPMTGAGQDAAIGMGPGTMTGVQGGNRAIPFSQPL